MGTAELDHLGLQACKQISCSEFQREHWNVIMAAIVCHLQTQ